MSLLGTPETVTTTYPDVPLFGTVATIFVAVQEVSVAALPLNVTALVPCVGPKFAPTIVIEAPTRPDVADKLLIFGVGRTVNENPLLATLLTVTTTFPVVAPVGTVTAMDVALQLVVVAVVPLNLTVLVLWVDPKFVPEIVRDIPTAPVVVESPVMFGAETTVNDFPLLSTPLA
jgi:hypothetical protein